MCKWWTWVRRNHPGTLSACAGSTENFTATPKRRRKELDILAGAGEGGESGARGGARLEKAEGSFEFSCLRRFNKLRKLRAHFRG